MTHKRFAAWSTGVLLALVATLGALVLVWDWNWFRGPLETMASERLGREARIAGAISVDLSLQPRIRIDDIAVADADWGGEKAMLKIDRLELVIVLKDLLTFDLVFPEVRLERPRLALAVSEDGQGNWHIAEPDVASSEERADIPRVERLTIRDGRVSYRDPAQDLAIDANFDMTAREVEGGAEGVAVRGGGTLRGEDFTVEGDGGSFEALRDGDPWPLRLKLAFGETRAAFDGAITDPRTIDGVRGRFNISGPNVALVLQLFGIDALATRDYELAADFAEDRGVWSFEGITGRIGDSDMGGTLRIDGNRDPVFVEGKLDSERLDIADLGPLIGLPRTIGDRSGAARPAEGATDSDDAPVRVFPDATLNVAALKRLDAEIEVTGKKVIAPNLPLDDMKARVTIKGQRLSLKPIRFGVGNGDLDADVEVNGAVEPVQTSVDARLEAVDLARIVADYGQPEAARGNIRGRVKLSMSGNSIRKALGTANGDVALILQSGEISALAVELVGLDLMESLALVVEGDERLPVSCGVAGFEAADGILTARLILLETRDSTIRGEGTINLGSEKLDLEFRGKPKDLSIGVLHAPVRVRGYLARPTVSVLTAQAAAQGAAAVALGALLTPLAALLPFIEAGSDSENADCRKLTKEAEGKGAGGAAEGSSADPAPSKVIAPKPTVRSQDSAD
ncbi:AsmA family protein [Oceanibacterium hippocampi]|uniref:Putative assembly protein n=1 Tax=Oceanibacterium hippocampi TaxID=745714 RepID=A0A1Y5TV22_9PROT|nr:AsmA family protein [Oceanibacterium hippocampi]SLN73785.1 putative assembly protein [Oceanibacterium hippocampi]